PVQRPLRRPISTSNRLKGCARTRPTFHQRPELGERTFEAATDEDALQLAVGHAVLARHLSGLLDAVEPGAQIAFAETDRQHHRAAAVAGSPQVVVLYAADRLRQPVAPAKVVDRAGNAVVSAPTRDPLLLVRRESAIDARHRVHQLVPAKH